MHTCGANKTSVSACQAVAEQADTNKTVLFRTNPRLVLEKIEGYGDDGSFSESESESGESSGTEFKSESVSESESESFDYSVSGESSDSEVECEKFDYSSKPIKRVASRKEGSLRGRNKQPWSQEECKVLWECYVRSGGSGSDGYIKRLVEMWDGRDVNVRPQAALLGQLRSLKSGRRLSEFEKREIERKVTLERLAPAGRDAVESNEEDGDVDFVVEGNREVSEEEIEENNMEAGPPTTADIVNSDFPKVVVEKLDRLVEGDGSVRILSGEEKVVLERLRSVFLNQEQVEIPSLKGLDRLSVSREVVLVNKLLENMTSL